MLAYVLIGIAAAIALVLILAATKPNTVHYARSAVINAPPTASFPTSRTSRQWPMWSPWEQLDPAMVRTYDGPPSGVGAKYHWRGNKKAGEGQMEIKERLPDQVTIDLHFIQPWVSRCITRFRATPEGEATRLTWTMDGPNTFMGKLFGLFVNMDRMIGRDFEKGLAALTTLAEGR